MSLLTDEEYIRITRNLIDERIRKIRERENQIRLREEKLINDTNQLIEKVTNKVIEKNRELNENERRALMVEMYESNDN